MARPIRVLVVGDCPELEYSELNFEPIALEKAELRSSFSQRLKGFEIAVIDSEREPAMILSFLRFFRKVAPQCPTLLLVNPEKLELLKEALKLGLHDFLIRAGATKEIAPLLTHNIEKALRRNYLKQRLHDSEQRFWTFFEHSPVAMAVLSLSGVLEYLNPAICEFFQATMEGLRERRLSEFMPERELQIWDPIRSEFTNESRDFVSLQQEFRSLKGEPRWAVGTYVLLREPDGSPSHLLASFDDHTDRKKIQKNLEHADKMQALGRLAGGLAHDFNNLLTIVDSHCYIIQESLDDKEKIEWSLSRIKTSTGRGGKLTRQLLTFGRRSPQARAETLDPNDSLRDLRVVLESLFGKVVRVDMALATELREIDIDRSHLEQVIVNLAVNARDAMHQSGGNFTIRTYNLEVRQPSSMVPSFVPRGEYTVIEVEDTGCGMTPEVQARVFEPFFTTKDVGQGTGLGLATVQSVIHQNDGFITVDSEPEKGTRFKIYLPSSQQRSTTPPKLRRVRQATPGLASETILLVEDEAELREPIKRLLESKGYHVLDAGNGEEALAISKKFRGRIDLLLTDVIMPGIDGYSVAQEIRINRPEVSILLMSGYTAEVLSRNPEVMEEFKLLQKPFGMDMLSRTIRQMLKHQ